MAARPLSLSPSGLMYSPSAVQKAATALASPELNALANASADFRTAAISFESTLGVSPSATIAVGGAFSLAVDRYSHPAAPPPPGPSAITQPKVVRDPIAFSPSMVTLESSIKGCRRASPHLVMAPQWTLSSHWSLCGAVGQHQRLFLSNPSCGD